MMATMTLASAMRPLIPGRTGGQVRSLGQLDAVPLIPARTGAGLEQRPVRGADPSLILARTGWTLATLIAGLKGAR